MEMKDCLLVGFNDTNFSDFVNLIRELGEGSGTWRDLRLAFAEQDNKAFRALDLLNRAFELEGVTLESSLENCDFVWPVLLILGSYLHRLNISFDYVKLFHREREALREQLKTTQYRAIVITTTVYVSPDPIIEIVDFFRTCGIDCPIIVGGPYISSQHRTLAPESLRSLFDYLGGDVYIVSSEGEATLARVIERLRSGMPLKGVANVAYRDNGFLLAPLEVENNDLAAHPVDYALFGGKSIGEFVSLRTAKSCPFNCSFCGFPQRAGKYVYTGVQDVERQLDAIAELGTVSTLTFIDDTFNVPKGRFKEILRLMIDKNYGFRWSSFFRSDHGDDETIELMAQAGCEGVFLGIESGCDSMLQLMNKTARKKDYSRALHKLNEVGISSYASFIVGYPGETLDSVQETIDFIEENRPSYYRAQLYYLDPATPVWRDREKFQIVGEGFEWAHPTMTSEQACDQMDRMFLTIQNSTWLPQHGFEDWSLYYLRRRGFTASEVRDYVRYFNTLVKANLPNQLDNIDSAATMVKIREIVRGVSKRNSYKSLRDTVSV
jgi:radical SAM PhpK family P-methyltransferase